MELLSTSELIEFVFESQPKEVEAELILNGGVATHFLHVHEGKFYDMGTDSQLQEVEPEEFLEWYKGQRWHIFQVV